MLFVVAQQALERALVAGSAQEVGAGEVCTALAAAAAVAAEPLGQEGEMCSSVEGPLATMIVIARAQLGVSIVVGAAVTELAVNWKRLGSMGVAIEGRKWDQDMATLAWHTLSLRVLEELLLVEVEGSNSYWCSVCTERMQVRIRMATVPMNCRLRTAAVTCNLRIRRAEVQCAGHSRL